MTQTIDESRAQLIADLQERAEELAQLNRIAIALTSEFDLQRLLQIITDAARKVTSPVRRQANLPIRRYSILPLFLERRLLSRSTSATLAL